MEIENTTEESEVKQIIAEEAEKLETLNKVEDVPDFLNSTATEITVSHNLRGHLAGVEFIWMCNPNIMVTVNALHETIEGRRGGYHYRTHFKNSNVKKYALGLAEEYF
jgi:hypothetical protein